MSSTISKQTKEFENKLGELEKKFEEFEKKLESNFEMKLKLNLEKTSKELDVKLEEILKLLKREW